MKLIAVCGSPRKGNCELMLKELLAECEKQGAETMLVLLRALKFRGCCGNDACYYNGKCYINDELTPILGGILKADALVLASSSYFNNVTGLMKNFMDRTNPYCKNKMLKGNKALLLSVGSAGMRSVRRCEAVMQDFCRIHGIKPVASVCAVAEKPNDAKKDGKILKKCRMAAAKLLKP